jgi:lipopolysaccharide assembly outer membrane protein LptD (OstA)
MKKKVLGSMRSIQTALLTNATLVGLGFSHLAAAQSFNVGPSTVYYDADEINLDKETGYLKAKGNAFFLLGNIFVSADHIEYNQKLKLVVAEGGVRVVRSKERITASRVLINEQTNEARMDDVEIYADPKDTEAQINEEVLGFSRAELAFEVARQERAKEIRQELMELRSNYSNLQSSNGRAAKDREVKIVRRYSQLLERLIRTQYQPSDVLRDLPEDARKRLENRREAVRTFATRDPELAKKLAGLQKVPGYLSMRARRIFQNSNQNLDVESASLTTCRCGPDESPAWGLSAARALVEPNEYITLYGSTLEVASFPLVYSPWFKMPIKTKRQSGFLLPSFYLSRAGDAASIPYYQTLGESADATLTFTYFSKKGPRAELEIRTSLSEQSQTILKGEVLKQKSTASEPAKQRWAWSTQSNLPLEQRTTLKVDFERTSDQRYYSDITKEPGATQDLFTPQLVVRRFLWQEAALEHSGENFALTARVQKPQDVFADNPKATPSRTPRLDFTLFPRVFGETGLSVEGKGSYEDILENEASQPGDANGPQAGERTQAQVRFNYPFRNNRFINIRVGAELAQVKYRTVDFNGELSHPSADLSADVPVFSEILFGQQSDSESRFRHSVTPFASIRWVPVVNKSEDYPDIYSTFYAADNIARSQTLEFGFHTNLSIFRDEFRSFAKSETETSKSGQQLSPPGREAIVLKLLGFQASSSAADPNQYLYEMTFQKKNSQAIFFSWAQKELEDYIQELEEDSSKDRSRLLTSKPSSWRRTNVMTAQPVGLTVRSNYNFEAARTAEEQNRNLQPGQTPVSADPWGDVAGSLVVSSQPWVPLSSSLTRIWKPSWKLFKEQIVSIDYSSNFGLNVNLIRSKTLSELLDVEGKKSYPADELWGIDTSYQPRSWLKFQVQYKRNLKPQPAVSSELEYSALQKITFLGIQDCVDITLQRFKDRDIAERMATWTIGLNLSFLGQQRQIESLGKVVDRAIKSQLNKGRNFTNL